MSIDHKNSAGLKDNIYATNKKRDNHIEDTSINKGFKCSAEKERLRNK